MSTVYFLSSSINQWQRACLNGYLYATKIEHKNVLQNSPQTTKPLNIPGLEQRHKEKSLVGKSLPTGSHVLGKEHHVEHDPANKTRAQFTEELQVNGSNTWVQLTAHEEVIDGVT